MASIHEGPGFVGKLLSTEELETRIGKFVNYYNHERYHESLNNLTPADVYYGRGQTIPNRKERIKLKTLAMRKQNHYANRVSQLN
jgi:putative transposase